ncbi:CRISPR-associated endonuclease Cas3'' [Tepidiforma sp.]|uniref:CRISPR-associated endonuclease Cas3'' n=1 Tax=Tepidiforma sp. TaxID=2682230 RepID=UPI002ADD829C|nr:CRISPR-associated endonuclease Cas3'' [Tepidiforma sp.]
MPYYARGAGPDGSWQLLRDHLQAVAERARDFARDAGLPEDIAFAAGLLHDLGKYSDEFQQHRLLARDWAVEHAAHGAALAVQQGAVEVAFAVAGHHAGLPSLSDVGQLTSRPERCTIDVGRVIDRAHRFADLAHAEGLTLQSILGSRQRSDGLDLAIRLIFSCLVDADRLDAEAWSSPGHQALRMAPSLDPEAALASLGAHLETVRANSRAKPEVRAMREEVLQCADRVATEPTGFFTLEVPTGGGKTLASLWFALAHARAQGLRRIIYVLPYLTIIEQTAAAFRRALDGSGHFVLEHHSGEQQPPQTNEELTRAELLAENWDAPIIITTSVQFFESLFSNHPTRCRKLHRIPRSVIVLDECQLIPPGILEPTVSVLKQLVSGYGCTVVFSTATQPAWTAPLGPAPGRPLIDPAAVRPIVPNPARLFKTSRRVNAEWRPLPLTWAEVAAEVTRSTQAMVIVNTRAAARELFSLAEGRHPHAVHLSTRMCPAHRRTVLEDVRARLATGQPCLLVATQLVEAGVDLHFPEVWRAMGPLDSLAQAAGRCNREGRLPGGGRFVVFTPEPNELPGDLYRLAAGVAEHQFNKASLAGEELDLTAPATFANYFTKLFQVADLDAQKIEALRRSFDFPEIATRYRMIEDDDVPVVVPFGDARPLLGALASSPGPGARQLLRSLDQLSVAVRRSELVTLREAGLLDESGPRPLFLGDYHPQLGLLLPTER